MLPCCFYHPVLALHVFSDYNILIVSFFKDAHHQPCQVFVDLCVQGSSLWQSLLSQPGDGLVEDAGVFVLYEEGQVGFVVDHMGGHGGFFFYGDIGGIADDEVQGWQTGPLAAVEDIELEEVDVGYQGGGVAAGDCQGFGTDITGMDKGPGKAFFQGDGDASAAGAYVQDGGGG